MGYTRVSKGAFLMESLIFTDTDKIGQVIHVDTAQIIIELSDSEQISKIIIGNLVAIETSKKHEFLIGLIDKVTRKYIEEIASEESNVSDEDILMTGSSDYIKINIIGTYKSVYGSKRNVFKRGVDSFPKIESSCYSICGENLQKFMNILGQNINSTKPLKIGSFMIDNNTEAILDGNKFFQRHSAILGSTGSGKSWCVANILEKASELKNANIIVFDLHGEYKPLAKEPEKIAESYKIAGPGDLDSEENNIIFLPYWLLNREEMLSMILDRSDSNAPNQASRFTLHVRNLKEETLKSEGKSDVLETFTVDSPIPFEILTLINKLKSDDTETIPGANGRDKKGDWAGKLTRFISRLEAKISDKTYGFMFQPNANTQSYDWMGEQLCRLLGLDKDKKGIKIIDFSEVPSDVLPIVTGTMARLLYDVQFWMEDTKRTPFTIICDEAHLYLPLKAEADSAQKQALYNFERIAKEGRKYGVSLLPVSQRPSDVSKTILSQCNNFIVLRLTNDVDKNVVKNLLPDSLKTTIDSLPLLDIGEALIVGDSILLPSKVLLDAPSTTHQPNSSTRNFWDEWDSNPPNNGAIKDAIEALRKQSRIK